MTAQPQEAIRLSEDGSIDTGHYATLAAAERRTARIAFMRRLVGFARKAIAGRGSRYATERVA